MSTQNEIRNSISTKACLTCKGVLDQNGSCFNCESAYDDNSASDYDY